MCANDIRAYFVNTTIFLHLYCARNTLSRVEQIERLTLREAREKHQPPLTQEQLEDLSGVNQATISGIETGRITNPANNTVVKLETALELARGTLQFETDIERQSRLPLKRQAS